MSTTTTSIATSTTVASVPAVLSCGPGPTPHVRPTTLTVGCATKGTTVTGITWSAWDAAAGGQGTGTVSVGFQSAPAIVVVFHDVAGIFQDVVSHTFERRVLDASDYYFDDSRDDPFDPSPNDDDDHWRDCAGRGVSARSRMGRELSASPRSSRRRWSLAKQRRSPRPPSAARRKVRGSPTLTIASGIQDGERHPERRRPPWRIGTCT